MQVSEYSQPDVSRDLRPLFQMHAQLCKAIANEHRLAMLYALKQGERSVGELAQTVDISIHNASQHLRVLQQRRLVSSRKQGQTVYYSITNPKFVQACTLIREALIEEHQAAGQSLLAADLMELLAAPAGLETAKG
jgi:DNA-binding transcriptional ArsR family regulator